MKLVLQIALGVFLGASAAILITDAWRLHSEELAKAETEKVLQELEQARNEQGARIRALLMQQGQGKSANSVMPPAGFIPDDAQPIMPAP